MAFPVRLRHLREHRPHHPRPGRRDRRDRCVVALTVFAVAGLLLAACGGSGNGSTEPAPAADARSLVPKLDDLGLQTREQGREVGVPATIDSAQVIYSDPNVPNRSVLVRIYVLDSADAASQQFAAFAAAFRQMPAEVLGTASRNVDAESPALGAQRKGFITEKPDGNGNSVWTDIYQSSRGVLLTQVLGDDPQQALATRQAVAERIVPRFP
jgi:hypothetical protein